MPAPAAPANTPVPFTIEKSKSHRQACVDLAHWDGELQRQTPLGIRKRNCTLWPDLVGDCVIDVVTEPLAATVPTGETTPEP